jgi:hypothetical protein
MSADIIARLKSAETYDHGGSGVVIGWLNDDPIEETAAEIERLRARVAVLEKVREAALPHLFTPSMETGIALLKAVQEAKP